MWLTVHGQIVPEVPEGQLTGAVTPGGFAVVRVIPALPH
jgi:hypothetical protein